MASSEASLSGYSLFSKYNVSGFSRTRVKMHLFYHISNNEESQDLEDSTTNIPNFKNLFFNYLEDFETHYHIFAFFLQTVHAIEKLLAGLNVQPSIGMNQSLI